MFFLNIGNAFLENGETYFTPYYKMQWNSPVGITYLASSAVECPDNQLLNNFQFEQLEKKKFRYQYECRVEGLELQYENVTNDWSAYLGWISNPGDRLGNVNFLDRQTVDCSDKGFLTSFYIEVDYNTENLRYIYTCGRPRNFVFDSSQCNDQETAKFDSEDYHLTALEHHSVKCNKNESLVKFYLRVDYEAPRGHVWYHYTCCSV